MDGNERRDTLPWIRQRGQPLEIGTDAEGGLGTSENKRAKLADLGRTTSLANRFGQPDHQLRHHRVAPLGPIERDDQHTFPLVNGQHWRSPGLASQSSTEAGVLGSTSTPARLDSWGSKRRPELRTF